MKYIFLSLLLMVAVCGSAGAVTCPVPQTSPAFNAGGNVFGRIASQWNAYFKAKVDATGGTLCDPVIVNSGQTTTLPEIPRPWKFNASTVAIGPPNLTALAVNIGDPTSSGPFSITQYSQLLIGDLQSNYPWLTCSGRSIDQCGTGGNGHDGAPLMRINGDVIGGDWGKFGGGDSRALNVGQILGWATSGAIPTPTFVFSAENPQFDGGVGGSQLQLMPDSTGCCGPGPFRAGRITAVVAPGSGHAVGEVCTLVGGTATTLAASVKILRIDNTGGVDTAPNSAYVYIGGTYSAPSSGTITMSETACSSGGSGATYDVEFGAPAFIDTQGAVQVVAYNSLAGGHQIVNFLGRSGVNSVTYIAQITEQGIHGYAGLKLEGSNTYPTTASSTILDEDSGVARLTSVGINASNNGVVAVNTTRSDGSNPLTILASTAGGTIVLPSGAIQARGLNDLAAASTVVLDEVSAGLARLSSFGPNASTNGQFELISERSDGSNPLTVISTSVVGDVIINTGSLQLGVVTTVGALGTCASGNKGYTKVVTDAAATPVYNATVAAGGSTVLAAFCNGTNWVNH